MSQATDWCWAAKTAIAKSHSYAISESFREQEWSTLVPTLKSLIDDDDDDDEENDASL